MPKPKTYSIAKKLILAGEIKTLDDLLEVADKTPLAVDMGTSPARFNKLIANPTLFTFGDCYGIADVIGVDRKIIVDLIHSEVNRVSKKRK